VGASEHAGAGRQRLGASRRLKRTTDFAKIRQNGQRLTKGCLILNWLMAPGQRQARLGVVASRKIGGAVVRSRAKRLLRESFRRHQDALAGPAEIVLVARGSIAQAGYAQVERDYLNALRAARLLATA